MAENSTESNPDKSPIRKAIDGLSLRSIGPAFMSGRIADIAIHPDRPNTWFVAVGSGGVWRTDNAGITWTPLFDEQPSYSIGCVRVDPARPNTVWVGTGEAVSGRHVAWGDGVYRSLDGGATWKHMGLAKTEHISDILIDPRDSDVVYVAAEGPLWSSGGERGLYKSGDAGESWDRVMHVDDNTGVTSAVFAPDDPDTIYAATYERRRRVWSFLGGGRGSGIHVSNNAGLTWDLITEGLPEGDMGRIGLAVTPADPELVYATVEAADPKQKGFYRSKTRGRSWERRNEYISGGTGPHYYQELFASPTNADRVYQVDVFLHVTNDGGKTFVNMETGKHKHSDNHVVWIDPANGDHLIVGCDAGIYETFDHGDAWRHVPNLPISQFYRVAVDNSVPFTNVMAGAQDLGTLHGPLRTGNVDGVRNQDWSVRLGADGYHVAFDPSDVDISYLEWQNGNVMRHDRKTMELVDIQPQPASDDPPERWNWDTPIVISPHDPARIYLASQRVWRSDDRGNSWTAISADLTTDQNRYELATAEHVASVDAVYDHFAMSHYCSISTFAESAVSAGLLYAGTDDGLVQVSEDGGASWRQAARPDGLSEVAFINCVRPSRHNADVVFVAADDHKSGDYRPYLYRSDDRGQTWTSIAGDLPESSTVWVVEQDHERAELLFVGAEHGVHVSLDGGATWYPFTKDVPTIAIRDLAVQRRDDDLVCGSFGRGIYVLDDYGPLRALTADALAADAAMLPVRDAWWYVPYQPMQAKGQPTLGTSAFRAPNPEVGATFTYHLRDEIMTRKAERNAAESTQRDAGTDVPFPGYETLHTEHLETDPVVVIVIHDAAGEVVRSVPAKTEAGLHRVTWDLRGPAPDPVKLAKPEFEPPWATDPIGPLVSPGRYSAELCQLTSGGLERLAEPQHFDVRPVPALETDLDANVLGAFGARSNDLTRRLAGLVVQLERARSQVLHLRAGLTTTPAASALLFDLEEVHERIEGLAAVIAEDPVRTKLAEPTVPPLAAQVGRVAALFRLTTRPPTQTQVAVIDRAEGETGVAEHDVAAALDALAGLSAQLDSLGGPYTPR